MSKEFSCPKWIKFLTEATSGNSAAIHQLQEFSGSCLDPNSYWGKALVLTGQGLGKSTFLKILRQIVGSDKTSLLPPSDFRNDFSRYELKNKFVNISSLKSSRDLNSGDFKAIFAGDPITAINNYGIPISFSPNCKLAFETYAYVQGIRRCLCIHFNNQPEEPDCNLTSILMKEIDSIRMWAKKGLENLKDQGCFTSENHFPDSKPSQAPPTITSNHSRTFPEEKQKIIILKFNDSNFSIHHENKAYTAHSFGGVINSVENLLKGGVSCE